LNRQNRLHILPGMTKTALAFILLTLTAVPAFAQSSQFGIMFGAINRRSSEKDRAGQTPPTINPLPGNDWKFHGSVRELYYSVQLEPGTRFKIKVGSADTPTTFVTTDSRTNFTNGRLEYVDGVIDYRFSESFGSTGIFGGVGLYRQRGGTNTESDYGLTTGINGDLPLSPRYGIVVEGAYHWTHFAARPHWITATAGLRIKF
jgi:hypothetical protein